MSADSRILKAFDDELSAISIGAGAAEKVEKNVKSLSTKERLKLLEKTKPELLGLCEQFNEKVRRRDGGEELARGVELHPIPFITPTAQLSQVVEYETVSMALALHEDRQVVLSDDSLAVLRYRVRLLALLSLHVAYYLLRVSEGAQDIQHHPCIDRIVAIKEVCCCCCCCCCTVVA
jgi:hypothetical protein